MKQKVEDIIKIIVNNLCSLGNIEAVSSADSSDAEILHPYFFISLDVYLTETKEKEDIPIIYHPEQYAFETSLAYAKDRFMVGDVPVRLEYKNVPWVESLIQGEMDSIWNVCRNGTYTFYRIESGETKYSRTGWLEKVKDKLKGLPDEIWSGLVENYRSASDHALGDMSSAVLAGDSYFFNLSLAGFIKNIMRLLFAINGRFEPSGRKIGAHVFSLPALPEHFKGRFDALIRSSADLDPARKREVAELFAKSVFNLIR